MDGTLIVLRALINDIICQPHQTRLMSFTEDNLVSKLSTLNETQESIVNISQWVLFYKRYASETARIWADYILRAPMSKRLALVYLANEIVQQARPKRKTEFIDAFARVIAPTLEAVYNNAPFDAKKRILRVVLVWVERQVFPPAVLSELQSKIKADSSTGPSLSSSSSSMAQPGRDSGSTLGLGMPSGSLFQSASQTQKQPQQSINPDLKSLVSWYDIVSSSQSKIDATVPRLVSECRSNLDSEHLPAPDQYLKILESFDNRMEENQGKLTSLVESRRALISEMESILHKHKQALAVNENMLDELNDTKHKLLRTKVEITDMITNGGPDPGKVGDDDDDDGYDPSAGMPMTLQEDENEVPAYSPMSSDEDDEPTAKKAKKEETKPVEGLNPEVAAFLSSLNGGSSLLG